MPAYAILMAKVNDQETYMKYAAKTPPLAEKHGGRFLVRGGTVDTIEGEPYDDRLVILEFPSKQAIHDFYADPEYLAAAEFRKASSETRLLAVEGLSG